MIADRNIALMLDAISSSGPSVNIKILSSKIKNFHCKDIMEIHILGKLVFTLKGLPCLLRMRISFMEDKNHEIVFFVTVEGYKFYVRWVPPKHPISSHAMSIAATHSLNGGIDRTSPDGKVHGAYMGPTWGRQDPGGPMLAPWSLLSGRVLTQNSRYMQHINGVVQDCSTSNALAMEILQFCTEPLIYTYCQIDGWVQDCSNSSALAME